MSKVAIVAALEREVSGLIGKCSRVSREHQGRSFVFFECDDMVVVCGGIGVEAARRAAEAAIAIYCPGLLLSVGFAGALESGLRVGDVVTPAIVIDARDGSRTELHGRNGPTTLVTFMDVAGREQKASLSQAYAAQLVDMEAAGVAAAARAHGIDFSATKVISDDSSFEMAEWGRFIGSDGAFKTTSFALFVALRPWFWGRAIRLAVNSRKAANALSPYLQHVCDDLRCDDLRCDHLADDNLRVTAGLNAPSSQMPGKVLHSASPSARTGGRE